MDNHKVKFLGHSCPSCHEIIPGLEKHPGEKIFCDNCEHLFILNNQQELILDSYQSESLYWGGLGKRQIKSILGVDTQEYKVIFTACTYHDKRFLIFCIKEDTPYYCSGYTDIKNTLQKTSWYDVYMKYLKPGNSRYSNGWIDSITFDQPDYTRFCKMIKNHMALINAEIETTRTIIAEVHFTDTNEPQIIFSGKLPEYPVVVKIMGKVFTYKK